MSNLFAKSWAVHFLFVACYHMSDAQFVFAKTHGSVTLQTNIKQSMIQEILWKFKGNKVVDWDVNSGLTEYLQFIGRTSLSKTTGDLIIFSLKSEDSGAYTADIIIHGKIYNANYDLIVIDPVSNPSITCKNDDNQTATTLYCEAEGAHLTYSWTGPGLDTEISSQIGPIITKEDNTNSVYICEVKNQVSMETIRFSATDCFTGKAENSGGTAEIVVAVAVGLCVLALVLIVAVVLWRMTRSKVNSDKKDGHETTLPLRTNGHDGTSVSQMENGHINESDDEDEILEIEKREMDTIPPVVPLKLPKHSELPCSDSAGDSDSAGGEKRGDSKEVDNVTESESMKKGATEGGEETRERGEGEIQTAPFPPPKAQINHINQSNDEDEILEIGKRAIPLPPSSFLQSFLSPHPNSWRQDGKTPPHERAETENNSTAPPTLPKVPPVVPLKPPKQLETDGKTPPHERVESENNTAPPTLPKVPPPVPFKPSKHPNIRYSDSAGDTDGGERREDSKEVDNVAESESIPPKPKDPPPDLPPDPLF